MSDYFIYYAESNIVCIVIFGIMLARDLIGMDRQEKQIKYDHALIAFMAYFVSDVLWAAVKDGIIPRTLLSVSLTNLANYILMAAVTYFWLRFVLAFEQVPNRERKKNKFAILFPFIVATFALAAVALFSFDSLIDNSREPTTLFYVFQTAVPMIYIVAVTVYALRKAGTEVNRTERRWHLYVGFFPLMVLACGVLQLTLLESIPVFCFSCTVLMLIFYIQSMDSRISMDPLTKLNNRGQLNRYISQEEGARREGRLTYVVMLDVNDFKNINDTYGHSEGDRALVLIADSLKSFVRNSSIPSFLGRYGGDEFVLIVHPDRRDEIERLIDDIRKQIESACAEENTPYTISVGAGCDEYLGECDSFQKCLQRADHKLYLDKEYCKLHGKTTVCK